MGYRNALFSRTLDILNDEDDLSVEAVDNRADLVREAMRMESRSKDLHNRGGGKQIKFNVNNIDLKFLLYSNAPFVYYNYFSK